MLRIWRILKFLLEIFILEDVEILEDLEDFIGAFHSCLSFNSKADEQPDELVFGRSRCSGRKRSLLHLDKTFAHMHI